MSVFVLVLIVLVLASGNDMLFRSDQSATQTESASNLGAIGTYMVNRVASKGGSFDLYPFNGKNFTLGSIAYRDIDIDESSNLKIFFSPADQQYSLLRIDPRRYHEIDEQSLRTRDFRELTSYAGRRNAEPAFRLTSHLLRRPRIILCDDDDGALHHTAGMIVCWSDGKARFMAWEELDMEPPDDRDRWLGPAARTDALRALSSR